MTCGLGHAYADVLIAVSLPQLCLCAVIMVIMCGNCGLGWLSTMLRVGVTDAFHLLTMWSFAVWCFLVLIQVLIVATVAVCTVVMTPVIAS